MPLSFLVGTTIGVCTLIANVILPYEKGVKSSKILGILLCVALTFSYRYDNAFPQYAGIAHLVVCWLVIIVIHFFATVVTLYLKSDNGNREEQQKIYIKMSVVYMALILLVSLFGTIYTCFA